MRRWCALVLVACSSRAPQPPVEPAPPPAPAPDAAAPAPDAAAAPIAVPRPPPGPAPFRLPHNFAPVRYRVRFAFAPADADLVGHVEIDGTLAEPTSLLWLGGKDLTIVGAVAHHGAQQIALATVVRPDAGAFALQGELPAGDATLVIDYTAPLREGDWQLGARRMVDTGGLAYVYADGGAIDARRYVPCLDEPDRKVPWELALDIPAGLVAAGPSPIASTAPLPDGRVRVTFAPTLPMPSYQLGFAVGPFDVTAGPLAGMRVLTLHGESGARLAAASATLLAELAVSIGVPYAYPSLDIVEDPALDNLRPGRVGQGLVAVKRGFVSAVERRVELSPILAELWFGALVTPAWWDDRWLAGGLARYAGADLWRPVTHGDAVYEAESPTVHLAVHRDADLDRGRLEVAKDVEHGAGFVGLVGARRGRGAVAAGLRAYLAEHRHGTATTADLVAALAPDAETLGVLDRGVPVLSATRKCGPARLELGDGAPLAGPTPVCVTYDRDGLRGTTCATLDADHTSIALPARSCPRWAFPDPAGTGMFRVEPPDPEVILATGWAVLTRPERYALYHALNYPQFDEKLVAFARLAAAGYPLTEDDIWHEVTSLTQFADDARYAKLRAWVSAQLGPRLRAEHLRDEVDYRVSTLADAFHAPWLVREAIDAYRHRPTEPFDRMATVYALAADDPQIMTELLAALAKVDAHDQDQAEIISGLSARRGMVAVLLAHPGVVDPAIIPRLIDGWSGPRDLADFDRLAKTLPPTREMARARSGLESWADHAKRLEPELRAWLR